MATFSSNKFVPSMINDLQPVVQDAVNYFSAKGFMTDYSPTAAGYMVSISKGGMFKAVLGLKTALNIDIKKVSGGVSVNAGIGIFGQQLIPTAIMLFITWPVLLSQIWGMVEQSKLDDEAIDVVEKSVIAHEQGGEFIPNASTFCTACGSNTGGGVKFCPECGAKQWN